ncbi:STAS domain-containing protein [Streptomyces sp. NPDC058613]|uniref:STAS domain-containing protein n=1 Tax=Streptomyces sp. NPDC058613 TaxID=3346556 RepID=UPI0036639C0C
MRTDDAVRIKLHGDFGYPDADALLDAVTSVLAGSDGRHDPHDPHVDRTDLHVDRGDLQVDCTDLHLDCTDVAAIDSSGLSVLLMARRLTDAAGVRFHLDGRPVELERMLKVTGTLAYLTGRHASDRPASSAVERRSAGSEQAISARSGGPDTTT